MSKTSPYVVASGPELHTETCLALDRAINNWVLPRYQTSQNLDSLAVFRQGLIAVFRLRVKYLVYGVPIAIYYPYPDDSTEYNWFRKGCSRGHSEFASLMHSSMIIDDIILMERRHVSTAQ